MNKQEIFDKVVEHARKQNKKAIDKYGCRYRTEDGLKCFIGALIPDDKYKPYMEGGLNHSVIDAIGIQKGTCNRKFLFELQMIHDSNQVENWEPEFIKFARYYNLNYNPPLTANQQ